MTFIGGTCPHGIAWEHACSPCRRVQTGASYTVTVDPWTEWRAEVLRLLKSIEYEMRTKRR